MSKLHVLQPPEGLTAQERESSRTSSSVIQPTVKSSFRDFVFHSDPRHRFLPGNRPEITKDTCGSWLYRGCLNYRAHMKFTIIEGQQTLSGNSANVVGAGAKGQDVVDAYMLSCGRLSCPVCYEKACGKAAAKVEHRQKQFKRKGRSTKYYHWTVSPPVSLRYEEPKTLWSMAQEISKMAGIQGGSIMFHHLRGYNEDQKSEDLAAGFSWKTAPASWIYSPHFHVIGVGFTSERKIDHMHQETGWVVKNLGERQSIKSTAHYQLSHAYIPEGRAHAIRWFGVMSYNKLKVAPLPPQEHKCPGCGADFQKLVFVSTEAEHIVKSKIQSEGVYRLDHGYFAYREEETPPWRGSG